MAASHHPNVTINQAFGLATTDHTATQAPGTEVEGCSLTELLPAEGEVVGGLYRLVRQIGEGMFGRVYVAERTDVPEHKVALKVMVRAVYAERDVERELVMLAAASHPHIVQLKDHGMTEHYVWFTMPFFEGEELSKRLERGPLGLREAYEIFLPIARGLQALHAAGLRHQDVKPENIYLARFADRVHPVLLDLGVAVEHNAPFVAGTVLYGSPEQVMALGGQRDGVTLSAKIDTYGLAATLLRSLVGPRHFPGEYADTPYELASAFIERENRPLHRDALPGLTGRPRRLLTEAMQRWLAYAPGDRATSEQMADQLDVLLEQEREIDAEIERGFARQKTALRRIRLVAGAMLLVGLSVGAFAYSKRQTLRLARDLERARAEGAASFDKLDTCIAAHKLTQREATQCASRSQRDKREFKATLNELSAKGDAAKSAMARRVVDFTLRLRTCEEDARKAAEAWTAEKDTLTAGFDKKQASWVTERSSLEASRDSQRRSAETCRRQLAEVSSSRDECRQDLATCIDDRDTCMADDAPVASAGTSGGSAGQPAPAAATAGDSASPGQSPAAAAPSPGHPAGRND